MAQLDALRLANNLRQRMVDFALDDNFVRDSELADICRSVWSGPPGTGGLLSDLWVEGAFPSKASEYSLDDLVDARKFDAALRDVLDTSAAMPRDRKLYTHQHESIESALSRPGNDRPSIVVTAGTGTGKTEAFLLPILDDLYRNPPDESTGAKCIILYPMNALVNDQVDRLYEWLKEQNRITLFHFTSETPEDKRRADQQGVPDWEPCRMRTRQQARGLEDRLGSPTDGDPTPDIVITNYSMLEYMLCRPQDAVFFGPALRTVVLDEAHLYTGTLAAEITLLLRRLLLRCGLEPRKVLQIATSATLGSGDVEELSDFAAKIFSKPRDLVHVIEGKPDAPQLAAPSPPAIEPTSERTIQVEWPEGPTIIERSDGAQELAALDQVGCKRLRVNLESLVSRDYLCELDSAEERTAVILHHALAASPLIHKLQEILWNRKHVPLEQLGIELFGIGFEHSTNATVRLLQLAASARLESNSYPLVPHRLHVLTRPTDGLTVCLNQHCIGPEALQTQDLGAIAAGYQEICQYCSCSMLSLYRCDNCGEWLLAGRQRDGAVIAETYKNTETLLLSIRRPSPEWDTMYIDPATGEIRGSSASNALPMNHLSECPNCRTDRDAIRPFSSGTPLTLSIVTETLLSEMPEFPAVGQGSNAWLPAGGRRLLAFSDSRREAARLGVLLTNQHEQQLVRSAIIAMMETAPIGNGRVLGRLRRQICELEDELEDPYLSPGERQDAESELRDARNRYTLRSAGGSVENWAEQLSRLETLAQLLDRPTSETHSSSNWKQLKWEDNARIVKGRAAQFLGKEFARVMGRDTTLEALGMVEVTYPGLDGLECPLAFAGSLPTESMRTALTSNWSGLISSLCDTLRADGVVTLGDDLDSTTDFSSGPIGLWASATNDEGPRLTRFVGATVRHRRRRFAAEILRRCGYTHEELLQTKSQELLQVCFNQLAEAARSRRFPWIEVDNRQVGGSGSVEAIRLVFNNLSLRRPSNLFRCETTGRVWPRSVLGCAPNPGSFGTLSAATHDQLDSDPRLGRRRREYRESPIFRMGLWSDEHSAQLDPRENRRLQDLFKSGIRNVLSATTTLELGIDIGGLNGVLMSNVPPSKSNYLQRAGRAGRRADGSSMVATFARPRPFDREVFGRVGDYLEQPLRRPMVFLDRERVVRRHLNSFLLNEFFSPDSSEEFTGAMSAFGTMGEICGVSRAPRWQPGENKPNLGSSEQPSTSDAFLEFLGWMKSDGELTYGSRVQALLRETAIEEDPEASWEDLIQVSADQFSEAVREWREEYDQLLDAWRESNDRRQVGALRYQLWALFELTVIEALADRQFLPHYGFPIGVQKLRVIAPDEAQPSRIREEDQYRLQRDSLLALREYVPGSQLLAGGRLVTSHGLLKHWTGVELDNYIGIRGRYTWCGNEHFYYWNTPDTLEDCPICGEEAKRSPTQFMFPRHGFSSAAWDPPKWSTNVEVVGEPATEARTFTYESEEDGNYSTSTDLGGIPRLSAYYKEDGELLVYNQGQNELGFAICLQCGYADSERKQGDGRMELPGGFEYHTPLSRPKPNMTCWPPNTAPVIRNEALAAREVTDVLLIDFSECLGSCMRDLTLVTTLGYALQRAAVHMLQLDSREIGVLTTPAGPLGRGLGALLYDNVPGGAGHVRELLGVGRAWIERARSVLWVNEVHHRRCKSACLDCLLSFDTQLASFKGLLNRRRALEVLSAMLDGGAIPGCGPALESREGEEAETVSAGIQSLSGEERLRRVRSRTRKRPT